MARRKPRPGYTRRTAEVPTRTKKVNIRTRWATGSTGGGLGKKGSRARNRRAAQIRKNRPEYRKKLKELMRY